MRQNIFLDILIKSRFYFFVILYFIEGIWNKIIGKKKIIPAPLPPDGEQWLEEGEVRITPKTSPMDAMAHKASFGLSQIPKEWRTGIICAIVTMIFFLLFGIGNFIYWAVIIIRAYPIVGYALVTGIIIFILYLIGRYIYLYFKYKKYQKITSAITVIWNEAKVKAELKFKNV